MYVRGVGWGGGRWVGVFIARLVGRVGRAGHVRGCRTGVPCARPQEPARERFCRPDLRYSNDDYIKGEENSNDNNHKEKNNSNSSHKSDSESTAHVCRGLLTHSSYQNSNDDDHTAKKKSNSNDT